MKQIVVIIFFALLLSPAFSQNKTVARKHFQAGEYEIAKPMFARLLKNNPRNSELNYWYAVCCYETKDTAVTNIKDMLEFAASRKISGAYRYLGDLLADSALYADAAGQYEDFLAVTTDENLAIIYKKKMNDVKRLDRMVRATERVCVIDSVVLDKEKFLSAYRTGRDAAKIYSVADFFGMAGERGCLSETERGTDVYYATEPAGENVLKLYHRVKMGNEWSSPVPLEGLDTGGNDNYPFMLADGTTLYFASDGEESIGGYDIFITRYDSDAGRYLRPDNVGMPFNSTANDYMMAVNEVVNLGWFATDRNQPEGKVCVYMFIPNGTRTVYDADNMSYNELLALSRLDCIAATQENEDVVRKAHRSLAMLYYEQNDEMRKGDFLFVIDDATEYTSLNDFKNAQARALFEKWQKASVQQEYNTLLLQQKRDEYATASATVKNNLRADITALEKQTENDACSIRQMEYNIRILELETLKK